MQEMREAGGGRGPVQGLCCIDRCANLFFSVFVERVGNSNAMISEL